MNERSKVQPPLAPRNTVTRNVTNRFVSPLPAATILQTPNSLRGSQTARPGSSSSTAKQQRLHQFDLLGNINSNTQAAERPLMIAAPPNTARPPQHQIVREKQYNPTAQTKANKMEDLDSDAPPSARLEIAKRTLLEMQNAVSNAEAFLEMRGDHLTREIQSSEFVMKMIRDSVPHSQEIHGLLEELVSRAPQIQVEFVSEAQRRQKEVEEEVASNNTSSNAGGRHQQQQQRAMIILPESGELVPAGRRMSTTSNTSTNSPAMNRMNNQLRRFSNSNSTAAVGFDSVNLEDEEDVDAAATRDGRPLAIEVSRGLAALQRSVGSVVEIFDACSSAAQHSFERQIERWTTAQAVALEQVRETLSVSDFNKVKQALVNANKVGVDVSRSLVATNSTMFALARDAASNISIGLAEARDSLLKLQHVINDLKNDTMQQQHPAGAASSVQQLTQSSSQAQQQLTSSTSQQGFASGVFTQSQSSSHQGLLVSNASAGSFLEQQASLRASQSAAQLFGPSSGASSPTGRGNSSTAGGGQQPTSGPNPFAGVTFVCVAVEAVRDIVRSISAAMTASAVAGAGGATTTNSSLLPPAPSSSAAGGTSSSASGLTAAAAAANTLASLGIMTGPAPGSIGPDGKKTHSAASGKLAMTLVRSFISNTVTPCGGHVVAVRPSGPFLCAFDSITSAMAWCRGLHLYGTSIPWPEDLLSSGNPRLGLVPAKSTKLDLTDATGLERAISTGAGAAAIALESEQSAAPPPVNQLSIADDVFFNAWRSLLSDGGVVNAPGGHLAQRLSRMSLTQMRETFNALRRGRLYDRRGPQFKIGVSFESLAVSTSSERLFQSLQRGGGFRLGITAATSLCGAARGGTTLAPADVANLFAVARNATPHLTLNSNTPIAQQAEEDGLKLVIEPPNRKEASVLDETGVNWLPLAALPEQHRFVLRTCNCERIFEVRFAKLPSSNTAAAGSVEALAAADELYDVDAARFDLMWWSRDDVTGAGGGPVVRPLQMAYLLPPAPVIKETCSREMQCDPVTIVSTSRPSSPRPNNNLNSATNRSASPDSSMLDETAAGGDDIEQVAAALQGAVMLGSPDPRQQQQSSSAASTARRRPGTAAGITPRGGGAGQQQQQQQLNTTTALSATRASATRGSTMRSRSGAAAADETVRGGGAGAATTQRRSATRRRRGRRQQKEDEIEIKVPPVMVERAEQTMEEPAEGTFADLDDDAAGAVGEACRLLESTVLWLSGTTDYTTMLDAVSRFTGPLHQLKLQQQEEQEQHSGEQHHHHLAPETLPTSDAEPTWDAVADTLLQHLVARTTFPVPPAQTTTLRLVVGGILTCVAEFIRSLPSDEAADAARSKFKKLFGRVLTDHSSSSTTTTATKLFGADGEENNERDHEDVDGNNNDNDDDAGRETAHATALKKAGQAGELSGDATLRILSVATSIAQQLRAGGATRDLDDADRIATAAMHASAAHARLRRRSRGASVVGGQQQQTTSLL